MSHLMSSHALTTVKNSFWKDNHRHHFLTSMHTSLPALISHVVPVETCVVVDPLPQSQSLSNMSSAHQLTCLLALISYVVPLLGPDFDVVVTQDGVK